LTGRPGTCDQNPASATGSAQSMLSPVTDVVMTTSLRSTLAQMAVRPPSAAMTAPVM
jgi:hypothetical protein